MSGPYSPELRPPKPMAEIDPDLPAMAGMLRILRLTHQKQTAAFRPPEGVVREKLRLSGVSNDLRYVLEAAKDGNARAELAVEVFVTGIVHYIGAFAMDLGRLDDLVFTAGIGEHSAEIRARVCERLGLLGVKLDPEKNAANADVISAADSAVRVRVIATNEELGIARRTFAYQ